MIHALFSILRGLGCTVAFALGLGGGCWAIHEALPFPEVPIVRPKVEHFAARHDDYDTLFVGSSRLYFQIIPALFDRLTAEAGQPTKTFNAGIPGMRPPEDAYFLDTLLLTPPKNLRWVFIELAGIRPAVDRDKIGTVRAVYWHDWERLWLLFRRALYMKPDPKKRKLMRTLKVRLEPFPDFFDHLVLFVKNQANIGRGSILSARLISHPPPRRSVSESVLGKDLAGWVPTGRPEMMTGPELANFDKALANRREEKTINDTIDPISQEALESIIAKVEKLGATAVLVVPPTTNRRNFIPSPERIKKSIVLDFCDLEKFPELYEHRYRLDTDHLNSEGAGVFTHTFVRTWFEALQRRP